MTYTELVSYIAEKILDNQNKEITAAIMRDVLDKIVAYVDDSIKNITDLEEGADLTEAVNILFTKFDNLNINFPVNVHTGTADPNISPPAAFNTPDFYIRNGDTAYIYNGTEWILVLDNTTSQTPSLKQVTDIGNTTQQKLIGGSYFSGKTDNDFAQIKDYKGSDRVYNPQKEANVSSYPLSDADDGYTLFMDTVSFYIGTVSLPDEFTVAIKDVSGTYTTVNCLSLAGWTYYINTAGAANGITDSQGEYLLVAGGICTVIVRGNKQEIYIDGDIT